MNTNLRTRFLTENPDARIQTGNPHNDGDRVVCWAALYLGILAPHASVTAFAEIVEPAATGRSDRCEDAAVDRALTLFYTRDSAGAKE